MKCHFVSFAALAVLLQMGYGAQKTGPIPANAWLEFDVSAAEPALHLASS
jgi:hypothetical protein